MGRRQGSSLPGNQCPAGEHEVGLAANNRTNEWLEEVRIVTSVGVKKCNDVIVIGVTEGVQTREARASIPRSPLMDHLCPVRPGDFSRPVDGSVVDDDDGCRGPDQAGQQCRQGLLLVLGWDDDVNA